MDTEFVHYALTLWPVVCVVLIAAFTENYDLKCLKYSGVRYLKLHLTVLKQRGKSGVPEVFVALQSTHSASPCFCCDFGPFLATVAACHRYLLPFPWLLLWACFRLLFAFVCQWSPGPGRRVSSENLIEKGKLLETVRQWLHTSCEHPLEHYPELQLGGRMPKAPTGVVPSAHGRSPHHPKLHSYASAHQKI